MSSPIENYGMIGNTRTVALVSYDGSLDWLCAPRFDSDACFAALLGHDEHGRWAIRPSSAIRRIDQRYRGTTLILETDVTCDGGAYRITEFMPPHAGRSDVVRIIDGLEGDIELDMVLAPRFGYGARNPWINVEHDGISFVAGPDGLYLRSPVSLELGDNQVHAVFRVSKGLRLPFCLTHYSSHEPVPEPFDPIAVLAQTEAFWTEWSERCTYQGDFRDDVLRSLITLKALTYAPTGGIVAAPTTSLPEELGGVRNWDYRFCWLRDATLTLQALMIGGYADDARAWRDWLLRAVAGDPAEMQIMYGLAGERRLTELELAWLPGYESSKPVRLGNAASDQFQLDIYGEVLSCLYRSRRMGIPAAPESAMRMGFKVLDYLERAWQYPDDGIWEVRGGRRHFVHSKVMAWTAIDCFIKLIEEFQAGAEAAQRRLPSLRTLRERVHTDILRRGFNKGLNAFTQYYGAEGLDASVLLMPHFGFLPADDPRMLGTVAAIERNLVKDGFVQRYSTELGVDGLPGREGAFLACSFWLADNYALAGRIEAAEELFGRLLALKNHLGLLAEEYDWVNRRQIGNFPQAFSHLALISSAQIISSARARRGQLAHSVAS